MTLPPEFWEFAKASPVAAVMLFFGMMIWWKHKQIWASISGLVERVIGLLLDDKVKDREMFDRRQAALEKQTTVMQQQTIVLQQQARGTMKLARAVEKASGNGNGIHVITEKVKAGVRDTDDTHGSEFEDELTGEDPDDSGFEGNGRKRK